MHIYICICISLIETDYTYQLIETDLLYLPTHLGVDRVALGIEVMLVEELHPPKVIDGADRYDEFSSTTDVILPVYPSIYLHHPPLYAAVVVVFQHAIASLLVPRVERVVAHLQG